MNNKTEYIDKLFAEARKEPLIMSAKEIDEIVRNAAKQPLVPTKNVFPNKFISSIGPKLIISVAAAAIVLTGASYLAFREQASTRPTPTETIAEVAEVGSINLSVSGSDEETAESPAPAPRNATKRIHSRASILRHAVAEQPTHQPISVKGINMVELAPAEASALGIGHTPDGSIEFVAGKNDAFDVKVILARGDVDIQNTTHTAGNALIPKFVTDNVGNRKLSLISNNNVNLIKTYSKDGNQRDGAATLSNVYISNFDQSDAPDNHSGLGFSIFRQRRSLVSQHGSNINFSFADGTRPNESINISINADSLFDEILANLSREFDISIGRTRGGRMSLAAIIKNIREEYQATVEFEAEVSQPESVSPADAAQDTNTYIDFQDLKSKLDSLRIAINDYNYLINLNSSVRSIDFQTIFRTAQMGNKDNFKNKYYPSSIAMRSWQYQADSLMSEMESIENELDAYLRVNKLVPVVVNSSDAGQSYIFWYEPTAELIDKLPARYSQVLEPELIALKNSLLDCRLAPHPGEKSYFEVWRACSGAIENLAISPNPVKTVLTASYLLTSERNCSVALHDLRGAKVSDLSAMASRPAGQINEQFPISGIAPGLYLLVVSTDNGEQAVQRVIIE